MKRALLILFCIIYITAMIASMVGLREASGMPLFWVILLEMDIITLLGCIFFYTALGEKK